MVPDPQAGPLYPPELGGKIDVSLVCVAILVFRLHVRRVSPLKVTARDWNVKAYFSARFVNK